jgi:murein DD-endopeptidase MepM/ murein hydrolase activator NlpD
MANLNAEITKLESQIDAKDAEIKRIVNYVEISNGENQYLEYLMGAKDFKDFIYRAAVAEQLSGYNDSLIKEYTNLVTQDNQKKKDLTDKQATLQSKQEKLAADLESLKSEVKHLQEISLSLSDEIKMQKEVIQVYLDRGCSLDQDIKTCGRETLPTTTAFYRPLASGYVTSEFSARCYTSSSGQYTCDYHEGIDFSNPDNGWQPVYAIGTGLVVAVWPRYWCGGNMVFVQHKMSDGSTYTSLYAHLRQINVSVGDIVTRDTVIGIMGGNPSSEYWDSCSTGPHIHLQIAYGLYMTDYTSWSTFTAKSFNPRSIINVPDGQYNWFYDRISKY